MISVLNRYLHGYVVVPVILSFIKKDFFSSKWLDYTIDDLAKIYSFNRGNFKTSLSVFESLGWVERSNNGKYCSSDSMPHPDIFNLSIERFFKIPLNEI